MPTASKKQVRIGDQVTVQLGGTRWRARVIENRGHIGVKGRPLFRVQLLNGDEQNPQFVEVPSDSIETRKN